MPSGSKSSQQSAEHVLNVIRSRRVTRTFTDEPVSPSDIRKVLEAGRWAASAGNRRIHKFIVVRDPSMIRLLKAVSPGMLATPTALIIICTDAQKAAEEQVQIAKDPSTLIDVGTAAMNMMIAAHAIGLGSCPATSFSQSGVRTVLALPESMIPEFILQLGHPAAEHRVMRQGASTKLAVEDLTFWERYGQSSPPD